ncbi:cupredoxin domain-containing protein [Halobellus clavatus]|jgi:plastocyanin|uniref:Plastocyanin n=1 Tax=Halobellus clavatus TaxID=660517 RepID=A0A1H3HTL3_9EURY|nr:plastocyanin/azurin family copper-binding protein [Halobellus clavatus]SDY18772.1 Plastocyanin [Halobellus clavatus]
MSERSVTGGRDGTRRSRRDVLAGLGTVTIAGLAGCAGAGAANDYDVGMTAVAFNPPETTIAVGERVVWRNTSSRGHTVTAYDSGIPEDAAFFASGGYDSTAAARDGFMSEFGGIIDSGETWSHTFEVPGTYEYFCIPHEQAGMVGTVVVEE